MTDVFTNETTNSIGQFFFFFRFKVFKLFNNVSRILMKSFMQMIKELKTFYETKLRVRLRFSFTVYRPNAEFREIV